jgi:hypothetical protein
MLSVWNLPARLLIKKAILLRLLSLVDAHLFGSQVPWQLHPMKMSYLHSL